MTKRSYLAYYDYIHHVLQDSPYKDALYEEDRRRRDCRFPWCALLAYKFSLFRHLYLSSNDQALLNATCYDHATFSKLVQKFKAYYDMWMFDEEFKCIRKKTKMWWHTVW